MSLPIEIIDGGGSSRRAAVGPNGQLEISGDVNVQDFPDQNKGAFGDLVIVSLTPVIALSFNYNINSYFVVTGTAGGGTVTQSASLAVLQTSAANTGSAQLESRKAVRYTPGQGVTARFTSIFSRGQPNSIQEIGVGDTNNGFFFMFSGSQFGVCRRQSGSDEFIPQSLWNGDDRFDGTGPSRAQIDFTLGNVYQIRYQWLGFGAIKFFMEHPFTGELARVHTLLYANENTLPSVQFPSLPLHARVANSGNLTNITLKTPSLGVYVNGFSSAEGAPGSSGSSKTVSTEAAIVTLQNKATFQGVPNRARIKVMGVSTADRAKAGGDEARFRLIQNTTLGGSPSFIDFDTNTSIAAVDASGTTVAGGREIWRTLQNAATSQYVDLSDLELRINPGEQVTVSSLSLGAGVAVDASITWREEFDG